MITRTTWLMAASFDQKFFEPGYIAYSGIESVARRALAMRAVASFDRKYDVMAESMAARPAVAPVSDALAAELAQEEWTKALNYGLEPGTHEPFPDMSSWDCKFHLKGHIVCPEETPGEA